MFIIVEFRKFFISIMLNCKAICLKKKIIYTYYIVIVIIRRLTERSAKRYVFK